MSEEAMISDICWHCMCNLSRKDVDIERGWSNSSNQLFYRKKRDHFPKLEYYRFKIHTYESTACSKPLSLKDIGKRAKKFYKYSMSMLLLITT